MARPPRVQVPGGVYHITSRGVRRQAIFEDDRDRNLLLSILGDVVDLRRWRCHAYCLMSNHYHLVIQTPQPNLSAGMHHLNLRYARRFNARYGHAGHLFDRRFSSLLIRSDWHLLEAIRYVVLNPVRARLCGDPNDWPWSSYRAAAGTAETPLPVADDVLSFFGPSATEASAAFRRFVAEGVIHNAA